LHFKLDFILGSRVRESADRGQRTEGQKVRRLEGRKAETRGQISEVRGQKPGVRSSEL